MVVLQRTRVVTRHESCGYQKRISDRLEVWGRGDFSSLVQMTERDMQAALTSKQKGTTHDQRVNIFNSKLLRGELKSAVRYITSGHRYNIGGEAHQTPFCCMHYTWCLHGLTHVC
jgi:hypothetical protein